MTWKVLGCVLIVSLASACYRILPDRSGGRIKAPANRPVDAADVAVPEGYTIELAAAGLTFPTAVTWDDAGRLYVIESGYSYGEAFRTPRLLRVADDGTTEVVASGENNGPWTGVTFTGGAFYVAEGGAKKGGALLRITPDGRIARVIEDLPTGGDHHTNGPVLGPDGKLYLGLGTMTNSAIVGPDNAGFGWLKRHPDWHDIPCQDVTLSGANFESDDPMNGRGKVSTGAYQPYGTATTAGQVITGRVPCSGAVVRVSPEGGQPELVGWGFRNPFGLGFTADGKLLVTDNGYDDRGSRPVWGDADWLWVVDPQAPPRWHGWPDYADGRPLTEKRYRGPHKDPPGQVLAKAPNEAPRPAAFFACHSSADGFDVSRSDAFGHKGWAFVALFGDQGPLTGKLVAPSGFKVVRVDPLTGIIEEFASNAGKQSGPASFLKRGGLERPVAARFTPDGRALYVVDFGVLTMTKKDAHPQDGTGVIWRITRTGGGR